MQFPHDHVVMGLGVAALSLACLTRHHWLLAHTSKGQRLIGYFGEAKARAIVAFVCLCGITFGSLLASGVIRPISWSG